jgi:hypothetical protein
MKSTASVDFILELVLHRGFSKVPYLRKITAILGDVRGAAQGGVFNPELSLLTARLLAASTHGSHVESSLAKSWRVCVFRVALLPRA